MVVTVFGLGFVGLTTAVGFAEKGIRVYGIDVDNERAEVIRSGRLPFYEPGLDDALVRNLGRTFFVTDGVEEAIRESDCIYYCVGTPYGEGGQADLAYLYSAIESTLGQIKDDRFRVLVTKSTVPPSTSLTKVVPFVEGKGFRVGESLGVANNPEFLREGHCWDDFMNADRIVLGVSDKKSEGILRELYSDFDIPVFAVSLNTGEFIKYLSNTLLAMLISYSNEMSIMADVIGGIDVAEAFRILHMDKRWGGCDMTTYAYPGCGYGGYCLPKDTNAIYSLVKGLGFDAGILRNVIATNDRMPEFITSRIAKACPKDKTLGILGLSFKPGSDDVRDTPAAKVIYKLKEKGYSRICAYDPIAMEEFEEQYSLNLAYRQEMEEVIEEADVLVILTAWEEFAKIPGLTEKPIIDCRSMH